MWGETHHLMKKFSYDLFIEKDDITNKVTKNIKGLYKI